MKMNNWMNEWNIHCISWSGLHFISIYYQPTCQSALAVYKGGRDIGENDVSYCD